MSKSNQREDNYLTFPWIWPMVGLLAMDGGNSDFVTFRIGTGSARKLFLVHKTLACNASPVLKAAFNSTFVEGQTQIYTMEDIDPGVFESLVKWLYTRKLIHEFYTIFRIYDKPDKQELIRGLHEGAQRLAGLWVLADRLLIPRLHHSAFFYFKIATSSTFLRHINIRSASQMYEFAVQKTTYYSHESFFQKAAAFLRAVLMYCTW
ncbi:hypothetical protein L207DRAFT_621503 [Hyaloscypha variabilis F]|uniref:BTB domain-containing protein n=1 Tax=Hyaloscypha variabilis (strain UAMH 11265 / GT02V1 / F) TaxID=1149755 RepID=A0A2J6RZ03_HYAVF|nr:hypothetical protein L207DRAFT_621503 [Hyaloscypha variabilis F]